MRMRGGRMIVNPVRYGSGGNAVKQVDVNVTTTVGGLTAYYMENGTLKSVRKANFKADAGSMLTLISISGAIIGLALTGATEKMRTDIKGYPIIFAQVNDA